MTSRLTRLVLVVMVGLTAVACSTEAKDVPSLDTESAQPAEPSEQSVDADLDAEAKMLNFVRCMRDEGIELKDPGIDSGGNVQRPELEEGVQVTREEFGATYALCAKHIEGLTLGRERPDVSEPVAEMIALATCLPDKGYDVDDPTAETLDQWRVDFRVEFEWDDPEAKAAYEECRGAD